MPKSFHLMAGLSRGNFPVQKSPALKMAPSRGIEFAEHIPTPSRPFAFDDFFKILFSNRFLSSSLLSLRPAGYVLPITGSKVMRITCLSSVKLFFHSRPFSSKSYFKSVQFYWSNQCRQNIVLLISFLVIENLI